jgi:ribokinase
LKEIADFKGDTEADYLNMQQAIAGQFTRHELSKIVDFFNGAFKCVQTANITESTQQDGEGDPVVEIRARYPSTSSNLPMAGPDNASIAAVVVMGSINMDLIATTDSFPKPNSNQPGTDFKTIPGGKGANEAVACGRLGVPVWMIGRVGEDDFGRIMMTRLSADANVDAITFDENGLNTGVAMIIKAGDTGDKTTTTCMAANTKVDHRELSYLEYYIQSMPEIRFLLTQLEINTDAVCKGAKLAHDAGKVVAVRGSPVAKAEDYPEELWECTDIVILGEWETPILLGKQKSNSKQLDTFDLPLQDLRQCALAAELLMDLHENLLMVVITTGFVLVGRIRVNKALAIHESDFGLVDYPEGKMQTVVVPHFKAEVVDVIGAADALTGAMVAALANGVPVPHALVWGTMSSMHSLEAPGAQESMPTLAALRDFMQKRNIGVHTPWMAAEPEGPNVDRWPEENPKLSDFLDNLNFALHSGHHEEVGKILKTYEEEEVIDEVTGEVTSNGNLEIEIEKPVDFQKQTLLHVAVMYSDLESVCHLLAYGANLDAKDGYGYAPMDRADDMMPKSRERKQTFNLIKLALLGTWLVNCSRLNDEVDDQSLLQRWPFRESLSTFCKTFCKAFRDTVVPEKLPGWTETQDDDCLWVKVLLYMMVYPLGSTEAAGNRLFEQNIDEETRSVHQPVRNLACRILRKVLNRIELKNQSIETDQSVIVAEKLEKTTILGPDECRIGMLHACSFAGDSVLLLNVGVMLKQLEKTKSLGQRMWGKVKDAETDRRLMTGSLGPSRVLSEKWWKLTEDLALSPLHFAALGNSEECAKVLVEWGMDLYDRDADGLTPIDLCKSPTFAAKLERLGLKNDAFISIGHTTETDQVVTTMANMLQKMQTVVWWDKNLKGKRNIAPGESWTKEITQAMRHSKTCVVVLTKKWLDSEFCQAEATMALNFNKPIFTVLPPVATLPEDQIVTLDNVPNTNVLYSVLRLRQSFNLADLDLEDEDELETKMRELGTAIKNCDPGGGGRAPPADFVASPTNMEVIYPDGDRYGALSDGYVVLAAGHHAPATVNDKKPFVELLGNKLIAEGIPYTIAYTPESDSTESQYWATLPEKIRGATLLLAVLEERTDNTHMNRVLQMAKDEHKQVMMVPYTKLGNDVSGLTYTANFVANYSCCFTDWTSSEDGFNDDTPAFTDIFQHNFLHQLDKALDHIRGLVEFSTSRSSASAPSTGAGADETKT